MPPLGDFFFACAAASLARSLSISFSKASNATPPFGAGLAVTPAEGFAAAGCAGRALSAGLFTVPKATRKGSECLRSRQCSTARSASSREPNCAIAEELSISTDRKSNIDSASRMDSKVTQAFSRQDTWTRAPSASLRECVRAASTAATRSAWRPEISASFALILAAKSACTNFFRTSSADSRGARKTNSPDAARLAASLSRPSRSSRSFRRFESSCAKRFSNSALALRSRSISARRVGSKSKSFARVRRSNFFAASGSSGFRSGWHFKEPFR
mmetsp:Transcript_101509/g.286314  ORF Transcript_101509/g.286314 Transcript_101509/m.286314 type:complete len:273 (-) Transcript_101509:154-972(-)